MCTDGRPPMASTFAVISPCEAPLEVRGACDGLIDAPGANNKSKVCAPDVPFVVPENVTFVDGSVPTHPLNRSAAFPVPEVVRMMFWSSFKAFPRRNKP